MTFKIVYFGRDLYIVKYRFHWYEIVYRTLRKFPEWDNPHLNKSCNNLGMDKRLFTYADAEAFVAEHTDYSLQELLASERRVFDTRQAELMRQWDVNRRKSLKVTK